MAVEAHGYIALDLRPQPRQIVRQLICRQRQPQRVHAAADVHAHRRRHDGADGRDHRAHRRPEPPVHVRHGRDMVMHEGQGGHIAKLRRRGGVDVVGEDLDRHLAVFDGLADGHGGVCGCGAAGRNGFRRCDSAHLCLVTVQK
jgi:hypothetical protein